MEEIKFGDIWYVDNAQTIGHQQTGMRPWVIVSNDVNNVHSPMVNAIPLTTALYKKPLPTHCKIISGPQESIALCEQVKTLNKSQLINKIGHCANWEIRQIKICLMIQFNLL